MQAGKGVSTELKVGLFTFIGLAVLAVIALTLEGNPFAASRSTYYTELDNVAGLGPRTQVRTAGVEVGEVTTIDIMPVGARVHFQVQKSLKIPKGSFLELRTRGLLGDVFLEIVRNEKETEILAPGSLIPKNKDSQDMNALISAAGTIAKDLQQVTRSLAQVFGSSDGQTSMQNILRNVEKISLDMRDLMGNEKRALAEIVENVRSATGRLAMVLERNEGHIDGTLADVHAAVADFRVVAGQLRGFLDGPNRGRMERILAAADESMVHIKEASSKVQLIVSKVERGEGTVGQLLSKDDTAAELKATLKSVQDLLRPATQLKIEVDYKGELRTRETANVGRTGNHFNVKLATRPDRFYLLGVSDTPVAVKHSRTQTARTVDGNTTTETAVVEVPEDRPRIRFNAQFAKRYRDAVVRFGLFESYAGIAGDLFFWSDRLQASVEAFDFGSSRTNTADGKTSGGIVRVKSYAHFFFTPHLYLTGGADNLIKEARPTPFFGAGLRFSDDDLKSVFGAAALAR